MISFSSILSLVLFDDPVEESDVLSFSRSQTWEVEHSSSFSKHSRVFRFRRRRWTRLHSFWFFGFIVFYQTFFQSVMKTIVSNLYNVRVIQQEVRFIQKLHYFYDIIQFNAVKEVVEHGHHFSKLISTSIVWYIVWYTVWYMVSKNWKLFYNKSIAKWFFQ